MKSIYEEYAEHICTTCKAEEWQKKIGCHFKKEV